MLGQTINMNNGNVLSENLLSDALEKKELDVYYQPKFHTGTGAIIGAEALLRWNHESYGFITPAEFIPLAEETGLIEPIGFYVLNEVCCKLASLKERGIDVPISINFSKQNLNVDHIETRIFSFLEEYNLDSHSIEIEITENVSLLDPLMREKIKRIAAMNIKIAVDDFGRGRSSIMYLSNPNLHIIKLDKMFMDQIDDVNNRLVIKTIVDLAYKLGKRIICEGVETPEQLTFLKSISCKEVQGFLFSKPLSSKQFDWKLEVNKMK
ncbi:EAL domain-containing protein (plasmid) [Alkalihalophilus sp. As8PL]|uniref:EAL domain-containing protein n=1 Tax=Alkalihalophilus sp. As8PL TaxID=3237103 RepID=A0AB39BN60_9BACI